MICCVTGHRPEGFPFERVETNQSYSMYMNALSETIEALIQTGYDHFLTGMAAGADLDFARLILQKRETHPHILLEAVLPYPNRSEKQITEITKEKAFIFDKCDFIQEVSPAYHRGCMQKRNMYMVDKANLIIAIWNGMEKGGTWNTIRYACQTGKPIQYIRLE